MVIDVGSRIREIRSVKGVTSTQLSQFLGVSQSFISRMESGSKKCSLETLDKICKYFEISMSDFFAVEDKKHIPSDIIPFVVDERNYSIIRTIQGMQLSGYPNEAIKEWLESYLNTFRALGKKYNVQPGKVVWTEGDTPIEEQKEITRRLEVKIKKGTLKIPNGE